MTALANKTVGRFELQEVLGEGGMGTVYKARDPRTGLSVALKLLSAGHEGDEIVTTRFRREILALSRLRHPNLVRIHEAGEVGGRLFFTMEHIPGESLDALVVREGRLSVERTLAVGKALGEALRVVHGASLIHRDIKPANVLLRADGTPVLTDFGLVKMKDQTSVTQSNVFVGTYQYSSPEVLSGLQPDVRSDLYQLGLLLYIMLSGVRLPFGETLAEIAHKLLAGDLTRLSALRDDVPPSLDACIMRSIERDPERRYPDVGAFLADLDAAAGRAPERRPGGATPVLRPRPVPTHPQPGTRGDSGPPPSAPPVDLVAAVPWLSTTAVHLLLLVAVILTAGAVSLRSALVSRPTVPLAVALTWIESDWDALSFSLGGPSSRPSPETVDAARRRLSRADDLMRQVADLLPGLMARDESYLEELVPLLPKVVHPLRLRSLCRDSAIDYESPTETVSVTVLRHLAERLARRLVPRAARQTRAEDELALWRSTLMGRPDLMVSLDRLLETLTLPTTDELLVLCHSAVVTRATGIDDDDRKARLQAIVSLRTSPESDELLAAILGPLTEGLSPRVWAARELAATPHKAP